jgi:hypothetical protein
MLTDGLNPPEGVNIPDDPVFDGTDFTTACWVRPGALSSSGQASTINKGSATNYDSYVSIGLLQAWNQAGPDAEWTDILRPFVLDEWAHLATRFSLLGDGDAPAGFIHPFLNGLQACDGTCNTSTGPTNAGTTEIHIGASYNGNNRMQGNLKDCIVFDRALQDDELAELFLCGVEGLDDGGARDDAYDGATCASGPGASAGCCTPAPPSGWAGQFLEDFELPNPTNCADEAYIRDNNGDLTTMNCAYAVSPIAGAQSLQWSGLFGAIDNYMYASLPTPVPISSGVSRFQFRTIIQDGTTGGTNAQVARASVGLSVQDPKLFWFGSGRNFQIRMSGDTNSCSTALVVGEEYYVTILVDHGTASVSPTMDLFLGCPTCPNGVADYQVDTPDCTTATDSGLGPITIDSWQLTQPNFSDVLIDDVAFGAE